MKTKVVLLALLITLAMPLLTTRFAEIDKQSNFTLFSEVHLSSTSYSNDIVRTIYNSVSETSYRGLVREFAEIGPKPFGSQANENTINWIISKLDDLSSGKIESEIVGSYRSVLGRLPGDLGEQGPCMIVGGHLDTVEVAPGANDDGSGVATALELARVFSQHSWPLDIYFGFWNAEEDGLLGSYQVADEVTERDLDVLVVFNLDMILNTDDSIGSDQRVYMGYNDDAPRFHDSQFWAELSRVMNSNYGDPVVRPTQSSDISHWAFSDHYAFLMRGFDNVVYASQAKSDDSYWHTPQDDWDNSAYDYETATGVVASMGAAMAYATNLALGQRTIEKQSFSIDAGTTGTYFVEMSYVSNITVSFDSSLADDIGLTANGPGSSSLTIELLNDYSAPDTVTFNVTTEYLGLHSLHFENLLGETISFDVFVDYDTDIRGDGVADSTEFWYNPHQLDSDNDGISDADELSMGTDPYSNDTDLDGLHDYLELHTYDTSPLNNDTDFDSMPDGYEIQFNLNPNRDDADEDADRDGLTNVEEYLLGTHPRSDDTEKDGMSDGWEVEHGLNPFVNDAALDLDGDGMLNLQEFLSRRDPNADDFVRTVQDPDAVEWVVLSALAVSPLCLILVLIRRLRSR
ncbi:MAG: M20/M25/M40 family metallo-hydrolase [Candidatus Thorarchaeota archaeon]|nr:MAG: M20/M25/M40 family metallo-hydrolase [Candidatus Thorarchaeota archaeon]